MRRLSVSISIFVLFPLLKINRKIMLIKCRCHINIQQNITSTSIYAPTHPVFSLCPTSEPDLHINTTIHIHSSLQIAHLLCIYRLLSSLATTLLTIYKDFLNFFGCYFSSYCSYGIIRGWGFYPLKESVPYTGNVFITQRILLNI